MEKRIKNGYIRFRIMDEEYTHNFTNKDKLGWVEHYVSIGRPEMGIKDFIRMKYMQPEQRKQIHANDQIRILSYRID